MGKHAISRTLGSKVTLQRGETKTRAKNNVKLVKKRPKELEIVPEDGEPKKKTVPEYGKPKKKTVPEYGDPKKKTVPEHGEPKKKTKPEYGKPKKKRSSSWT